MDEDEKLKKLIKFFKKTNALEKSDIDQLEDAIGLLDVFNWDVKATVDFTINSVQPDITPES